MSFDPVLAADAHSKLAKYYQFCTSELKISKKDLPKFLVEKLDKGAKDMTFRKTIERRSLNQPL